MKKRIIALSFALFSFGIMNVIYGQAAPDAKIVNWYNGKNPGMNTEKAYAALKNNKSTTVIVAVIDSGIDIEHKDLQGKIWVNEDEIPNNGIDDDKNGYIDDVHGWSFLGSSNGTNQQYARLEKTRLLASLSNRFYGKESGQIAAADRADYDLFVKLQKEIKQELEESTANLNYYKQLKDMLPGAKKEIEAKIGANFTVEDVKKWTPASDKEAKLKRIANGIATGQLTIEALNEGIAHFEAQVNYQLNTSFNDREFIGDNADDMNDIHYGSNDVEGPDALHGTHVGGIIGSIRGNNLGGDGVCENVKLMSLRAVPDGDEQDKDIALAIRYAVDNGAQVINMSFGKAYSMHQKEVYEAFAYADSKGVLLIHAAGNDAANVDATDNFPTSAYSFQTKKLDHYLTIGASTKYAKGLLAADFSNYGKTKVDVFAPGFEIYNSVPQSDYQTLAGTSMAAPMVAGAAAFLKSYFPSLSMSQIKEVLLKSAKSYKGAKVNLPGTEDKVDFADLSVTGAVIDLAAAVKLCKSLTSK